MGMPEDGKVCIRQIEGKVGPVVGDEEQFPSKADLQGLRNEFGPAAHIAVSAHGEQRDVE